MDRCPISELPSDSCYDCRHDLHGKRTPQEVEQLMTMDEGRRPHLSGRDSIPVGTVVKAEWPGKCNECENDIRRGDMISRAEDGTWVHRDHDQIGSIEGFFK